MPINNHRVAVASKYYQPVLTSRHRYNILFGGRMSAKTHTVAQKMTMLARTEQGMKGVLIRNTYNTIKDSQYSKIESFINSQGWQSEFRLLKSPLEITHLPTGNKILARGLDDPDKIKSLDDPTVIWIEEANEISIDSFVKLDTSIRSANQDTLKQMILTFNPEDEEFFLNDLFFPHKSTYEKPDGSHTYIKSIQPNTLIMHSNFRHNDFLSKTDLKTIDSIGRVYGFDSNYYKVYVKGLWGNALKGLVFENVNYVDQFPKREDCKKYGYGLDFGFTNDPTAISRCALAHGELWIEELVYERGLTNTGANSIANYLHELKVGNDLVIADSAEPKSIAELCNAGFKVIGVKKGKDSVEAGINKMKQYKINIVGSSPNLKKEIKTYRYQEAKDGMTSEFTNKPIDAWNHLLDGSRYFFQHSLTTGGLLFA